MKTRLKLWFAAALVAGAGVCTARAAMTHTAATLDTRAMVLAEILPESCTYATTPGDCVTLTVTFTADLAGVGPFVLPDNMGPIAFNMNGKTVTGRAGSNGGTSADGGAGSPVFRVGGGTTVAITESSGSITGGAGGDGKKGGAGAYAFVNSSGEPFAVSDPGGLVRRGADGRTVLPSIPYRAWNEKTRRMEDRVCTDYEIVTAGTQTFEDGKWYVVRDPVERGRIEVKGAAHLILCDGVTLTAKGGAKEAGIAVVEGRSLSLYGQTLGTGELAATGDTYWAARCVGGAGIGGDGDTSCGSVTINGGVITAKAMGYAAGIGGGTNGKGGTVTINGGLVNANGGPYAAGIGGGNGNGGEGGTVTINGGTVRATHSYTASDIGDAIANRAGATVTINGGSVKAETIRNAPSNGVERVFCVTVKWEEGKREEGRGKRLKLDGLGDYGTNDIFAVDGCVYLWLPDGTHRFTVSDGEKTLRYCAVVKGKGVTVEPLGPVGFFVNGTDVAKGSGTGWTYDKDGVLLLGAGLAQDTEMTFVLTGEATNNQVQVKAAHQGATVVLSNAVVFTEGRPALDVTENVRLLMTGGESDLVATNESAAITVAQNAKLSVDCESYANSRESMIGVFNFGDAATIGGAGSVSVTDGTFFVWGDNRAIGLPEFRVSGPELMMAGETPEEMKYTTTDWALKKCVLVGPSVTVTVKTDIPHVTGFTVSNAVEEIQVFTRISDGTVYRVMLGDDVFVGYTLEAGYVSQAANPLVYAAIEGDVTVDADTIPVVQNIPYRAWNESTRQMEDRVCTDYEIVTAGTQAFEDGKWYVVRDSVARGTITVGGEAHLILCDGAALTVTGADQPGILLDYGKSLTVCGQSGGSGTLKANGGTNSAGIGSGSRMSATAGELTVDGGIVLATGQGLAAGIGGSDNNLGTIGWKWYGNGGKVTVNGGRVTATPGYGGSMGKPAAIGGGSNGAGGDVVIRGGTVNAIARNGTGIGMGSNRYESRYATLTIDGGSVKAQTAVGLAKNAADAQLYCVKTKVEGLWVEKLSVEGLDDYGTNDIFAVDGYVYLWLPDGTHRFSLSDGEKTLRYCAIVNGRDVTIEPLAAVGFLVNGVDINEGPGTGWTYGEGNVLSLNDEMAYVLSGEATNNEVQVRVAHQGATVVLSNAVVFASGRPALDITQTAALLMAGGESYLVSTNESAAVSVAEGVTLTVGLAPDANRLETAVGVFNFGAAAGIAGKGAVRVDGGTFCVWADVTGLETTNGVTCGADEIMMAGKTPEEARYATESGTEPCILVAPAVTVTVKSGIPHVTGFTVSNAVEAIEVTGGTGDTSYRVMLGDDVFVGYTLEAGYTSQAANPLVYAAIEGDVTIDANTIPTLQNIPYRAWNETTRQMEDCVCTNYTFVTADTETLEDGKWYVAIGTVERGTITVGGAAHLILCDGAKLTCDGTKPNVYQCGEPGILIDDPRTLCVYGQADGSGILEALGADNCAGIGSGAGDSWTAGGLTVNGGAVLATGRGRGAGIGGSNTPIWANYGNGGPVTVNGGRVTATGGEDAAGIGGGAYGRGGAVMIRGGTVVSQGGQCGIGHGYNVSDNGTLTIDGGSVKGRTVDGLAKNSETKNVYCVTVKCPGLEGSVSLEGLEGYGTNDIYAVEGEVCLWLPDGTHRFAISCGQTTRFYYAKVDGGSVTVDPLEPLGFRVNGVDVFEGSGTGWSYDGDVLMLDSAMTYVLSGAATNNEVQVRAAANGAAVVLSNAVVFASGRPAVVVAQGAALMTPADEVMKAGETPETLKYTTTCGAAPCVVAGPAVTVTVKVGIPHATDFTVSNAVEAIRGFAVVDGTAYRVMLGEDVFVGYAVEEWYYSHSENPLAYAAVEGDVTVDAGSVRILPIIPYRAWNETTRQAEDRACTNYTFVTADTATFEDGRWYVATGAVLRGSVSVAGAAHLILCDGARLTAEAITNGTLAVYGQLAGCGELVVSNGVASSLSVQGGRLSAGALSGDSLAIVGGTLAVDAVGDGRTTIDGGSVKVGPDGSVRVKAGLTNFVNRAGQPLHCVKTKVEKVESVEKLRVEGLGDYGTNDIYPIDGCVYLWLPNGTHRFALSDGEKTQRYCAVVNGRDVTVEPLGPFGFFVNGTDVTEGSGTGWTYDVHGVLTLGAGLAQDTEMTYVLTGEATNDEVQVKVAQTDATVVVSNAVVMAAGRPALVVERTVALRMAGGESYFVSTNESAAISVAQDAEIRVNGMRGEDGLDPTVGVCNSGSAAAISGGGTVRVDGGTFFVWADVTGPETPNGVIAGAARAMKVGKTPETLRYATSSGTEPCILIAQAVIVTVKNGIPHASGFTVSNAVEEVGSMDVPDGKVYRAMVGDDIFIGYALEEGYVSPAANPLVYRTINGDVTVDANTIPTVLGIPYRAWNETTRQMEDRVCTNYTVVAEGAAAAGDGDWYVVAGTVSCGTNAFGDAAHLILCDGSRLTAEAISNGTLAVYGQAENTGSLVVTGTVDAVLTVVGGNVKADRVSAQAKNAMGQDAYCVTAEGMRDEGRGMSVSGLEEYGIEKAGLIDGRVCLWLPDGTHRFTVSDGTMTNRYCAVVDGRGVTVEPLGPVGFFADGVDVGEAGAGDGWHYQEKVLTLDGAKSCVLSGEATNDEVQVNAAADGATAVLSNAFVFTEGRPAVVVAQGAALAVAGNQAMKAGDTPETLEYALACGNARCVLAAPGAVITVKDIPHVSDVVVSNLTGTVPGVPVAGVPVSGGTVYRVLLGDDVFVGYKVDPGYVSPAANPLRYAAVGGDVTVDRVTIPVISERSTYIDRWNGTNETVAIPGDRVYFDANLTTLASGVTYVVAGLVTNSHRLYLSGPATLVVCDGATLVAEGGFTSFYAPAETNALSIHGQAAGDGVLFAKDFRCVDVAIHGVTTVTDGIFDGTPVILGGTVSANAVSNDQKTIVAGGSVWVENMQSFAFDGAERSVHSVICPVPWAVGRVTVVGLEGYCTEDIFPVDGRICLYLPKGEYMFTVDGVRMRALVLGDGTVAERDVGGYLAYGRGGELLGAFDRLTNAVHAAADGGMVKLTNDCHEAGAFVLPEGAAVTLDGCGYRLTLDATDSDAPSALVSTNAALCLTNLVLTRTAVSRRSGLLEIADGGALEMRDCAVTNCNAYGSPLISAANGGFRAAGVMFFENTASALVKATVGSEDARFAIANWSAVGNVCDELFSVGNLSGRVDACEIGAGGQQVGNTCRVADLVVGVGPVCLCGAPPLPKVRLAGFAMSEDALHSHLVYRDTPPRGGVSLDVSSPDARIGSVIVSNAFNMVVAPQAVNLVTPGCRVAADAFGNLRLERAWARPFIVRTTSGDYSSYASVEEAISRGGRDLLLMSYEENGSSRSTLSGKVTVPPGEQLSLNTVRLTVTTNENWTVPSPDPVTLNGDISVGTNGVLVLGNVILGANHEIFMSKNSSVMVEALPPPGGYHYFRFSQDVIDNISHTGYFVASTRLNALELRNACVVLNEGYEFVAREMPGLSGALWLKQSTVYEARIDGESELRPSFIGAMESANGVTGHADVTMYALSYTNETDGAVIGGYASRGRGITIGGASGTVTLTVGSMRYVVRTTGERVPVQTPAPPTQLDLGGSTLTILKDSVLKLKDVNVTGTFTLAGEGLLDLTDYRGPKLTVSIDRSSGVGYRPIARGNPGLIELAPGQQGELVVNAGVICWQLGVTCEYKQVDNGKVDVSIYKNGALVKTDSSVKVTNGSYSYTYTDNETNPPRPYTFTLYALYMDTSMNVHVAPGTQYLASDGTYKTLTNGARPPDDMLANKNDLSFSLIFPDGLHSNVHLLNKQQEKEITDAGGLEEFMLAGGIIGAVSALVAAGASPLLAKQIISEANKWIGTFAGTVSLICDIVKVLINIVNTIVEYNRYPLAYKKGTDTDVTLYMANQFVTAHEDCAKDNGNEDKGRGISWRKTHQIKAEMLPTGFVLIDAKGHLAENPWLQKLLFDYTSKISIANDALGYFKLVCDIIGGVFEAVKGGSKFWIIATVVSFLADKAVNIGLAIAITKWQHGFFEPPIGGSVVLPFGCNYDVMNMRFDGAKATDQSARTAPILVARRGSILELDTCELKNFKYSSPSGLVYVCRDATLILKDFTDFGNNTCTTPAKTPPIVAEGGATVWLSGKTSVPSIQAVGADLRIGYGPHGKSNPQDRELTGTGEIKIVGETAFGTKIGTVWFQNATSKALDRIVSQSYSQWIKSAISEDGKSTVWKLTGNIPLSELEPIKFNKDAPFSISVSQSSSDRSATLTGGLAVPTQKARNAFPLEFSLISTDDLRKPFSDAGSVTVNAAGYFTNEVRNLQSTPTRHFRLKYRWRGAPDRVN